MDEIQVGEFSAAAETLARLAKLFRGCVEAEQLLRRAEQQRAALPGIEKAVAEQEAKYRAFQDAIAEAKQNLDVVTEESNRMAANAAATADAVIADAHVQAQAVTDKARAEAAAAMAAAHREATDAQTRVEQAKRDVALAVAASRADLETLQQQRLNAHAELEELNLRIARARKAASDIIGA